MSLLLGAELHDVLHAGAVVPAAIEEHDFMGGGQLPDVALEVPLGFFTVTGLAGGHDPHFARTQVRGDALYGAVLAGGVPAFEDHQHLAAALNDVPVQLDQLDLQAAQFPRALVLAELRGWPLSATHCSRSEIGAGALLSPARRWFRLMAEGRRPSMT